MIIGLLLAAGGARRFGSQKLIASLDGVPLVRYAADTLRNATDAFLVVVGSEGKAVRDALAGSGATFVENPEWELGLSSSIRRGVAALAPTAEAVVVMLGDEPRIDPAIVRDVVVAWQSTGSPIVAARYRGKRGHPVLFDRSVFAELAELTGDVGAKPVLERNAERLVYVDVNADVPRDVDAPGDLGRLSRL